MYATPNFLTHFDFKGIADPEALKYRVRYVSSQLGMNLKLENTGCSEIYKMCHFPIIRFGCITGNSSHYAKMFQINSKHNAHLQEMGI